MSASTTGRADGDTRDSQDLATATMPETNANIPKIGPGSPSKDEENATQVIRTSLPTPPDGGLQAWLQVLGGFLIYFNTWGLMISFGVFQSYYENHLLSSYSSWAISWIGTLQAFFLIEIGVITGPLYDQGYLRYILAAGTVLLTLGVMMASIASEYYSVFLSLGVCTGMGMGCMFFPGVTSINTYFSKRRGLASGIAALGSGVGAIVYPIVLRELISRASFGWALRAVGFIILVTSLIPLSVVRPLWLPSGKRKLFDRGVFQDFVYTFWSLTNVISWIGLQIPLFYLTLYATDVVGISQQNAFYMTAILGAGSLPGRVITSVASDKFGPLWVYAGTMTFAGFSGAMTTTGSLILFYGAYLHQRKLQKKSYERKMADPHGE